MDNERYQTIFAKDEGAVAAPSAGLHFSKHLMKRLEIKGVDFAETTLHIGLGTFAPVEVEDLSKHKMDSEQIVISASSADMINKAKIDKKKNLCCRNHGHANDRIFGLCKSAIKTFYRVD